jgi:hypothetical protein
MIIKYGIKFKGIRVFNDTTITIPAPLAFYTFNNTSESIPLNYYPLTNISGVTYGAGKINECAIFDAENYQGFASSTLPSLTTFTITAWVKATTDLGNYRVVASKWDGGNGWNFFFGMYDNGDLVLGLGDGNESYVDGLRGDSVCDGDWNFVVGQCDPTNGFYRVKANNGSWTTGSITSSPQPSTQPFEVASNPAQGVSNFDGSIDALGVWDSILTNAQIASLWNNGNGIEIS